jgi:hypothetical protein
MKTMLIAAITLLFVCNCMAQDASKAKTADVKKMAVVEGDEPIETATGDEVKARADQGATGIHELPAVREEVEREKLETDKAAAAAKAAKQQQQSEAPSATVEKIEPAKKVRKITPKK